MDCKKCGALVKDGAVFCSTCGNRLDGKKKCPNCNNDIEENSVYCEFCGERVDGKSICPSCGEVIEGAFCSKCGTKRTNDRNIEEKAHVSKKQNTNNFSKYLTIEKYLVPSLCLGLVLILFVCSFFIGVGQKYSITSSNGIENLDSNIDVFYFFGESFKDIETLFFGYIHNIGRYQIAVNNLNTPYIILLIFIILNFVAQLGSIILGAITMKGAIQKGKRKAFYIATIMSFCSFLFTAAIVSGTSFQDLEANDVIYSYSMSTGSIVGIVLASIFLVGAIVLSQIAKGKKGLEKSKVIKLVFSGVFLVVAVLGLGLNNIDNVGAILVGVNAKFSALMFFVAMNALLLVKGPDANSTVLFSGINVYLNLVISLGFVCILLLSLYGLFFENGLKKGKMLTTSIIIAVSSLVYLIFTIISLNLFNELLSGTTANVVIAKIGTGSIASLVISVLILACTIAYMVVKSKKIKEVEEQN